jgi:nucleoside-diphosphate-sugar epimerase
VRIFLAGASGVIGRRLSPLLLAAGHGVVGMTRSRDKAAELARSGVGAVVVDVFDAATLNDAILEARPDVVMHQLTDLPQVFDRERFRASLAGNAKVRIDGTTNLVAAARAAGVRRLIAQSIAFAYAEGAEPHRESDPLASAESDSLGAISARGVRALEHAVLNAPGIDGIVLRYGRLYGRGTWSETASARAPLHVEAAAHAALLALTRGAPGIYNIAEDDGAVTVDKARRELGFDSTFRLPN